MVHFGQIISAITTCILLNGSRNNVSAMQSKNQIATGLIGGGDLVISTSSYSSHDKYVAVHNGENQINLQEVFEGKEKGEQIEDYVPVLMYKNKNVDVFPTRQINNCSNLITNKKKRSILINQNEFQNTTSLVTSTTVVPIYLSGVKARKLISEILKQNPEIMSFYKLDSELPFNSNNPLSMTFKPANLKSCNNGRVPCIRNIKNGNVPLRERINEYTKNNENPARNSDQRMLPHGKNEIIQSYLPPEYFLKGGHMNASEIQEAYNNGNFKNRKLFVLLLTTTGPNTNIYPDRKSNTYNLNTNPVYYKAIQMDDNVPNLFLTPTSSNKNTEERNVLRFRENSSKPQDFNLFLNTNKEQNDPTYERTTARKKTEVDQLKNLFPTNTNSLTPYPLYHKVKNHNDINYSNLLQAKASLNNNSFIHTSDFLNKNRYPYIAPFNRREELLIPNKDSASPNYEPQDLVNRDDNLDVSKLHDINARPQKIENVEMRVVPNNKDLRKKDMVNLIRDLINNAVSKHRMKGEEEDTKVIGHPYSLDNNDIKYSNAQEQTTFYEIIDSPKSNLNEWNIIMFPTEDVDKLEEPKSRIISLKAKEVDDEPVSDSLMKECRSFIDKLNTKGILNHLLLNKQPNEYQFSPKPNQIFQDIENTWTEIPTLKQRDNESKPSLSNYLDNINGMNASANTKIVLMRIMEELGEALENLNSENEKKETNINSFNNKNEIFGQDSNNIFWSKNDFQPNKGKINGSVESELNNLIYEKAGDQNADDTEEKLCELHFKSPNDKIQDYNGKEQKQIFSNDFTLPNTDISENLLQNKQSIIGKSKETPHILFLVQDNPKLRKYLAELKEKGFEGNIPYGLLKPESANDNLLSKKTSDNINDSLNDIFNGQPSNSKSKGLNIFSYQGDKHSNGNEIRQNELLHNGSNEAALHKNGLSSLLENLFQNKKKIMASAKSGTQPQKLYFYVNSSLQSSTPQYKMLNFNDLKLNEQKSYIYPVENRRTKRMAISKKANKHKKRIEEFNISHANPRRSVTHGADPEEEYNSKFQALQSDLQELQNSIISQIKMASKTDDKNLTLQIRVIVDVVNNTPPFEPSDAQLKKRQTKTAQAIADDAYQELKNIMPMILDHDAPIKEETRGNKE